MSFEREKEKGKRPEPGKVTSPGKKKKKQYKQLCYPIDDATYTQQCCLLNTYVNLGVLKWLCPNPLRLTIPVVLTM